MYKECHEKIPFVPSTTLKNPLHIPCTINKPLNSSPDNFITNSNNNNNSIDKNKQEYNHYDISYPWRIKVNKEEKEVAQKRPPSIMNVTAITNNNTSISKRCPSFDDLQPFFYKGDHHNIHLPRIHDGNSNRNGSNTGSLPTAAAELYDSNNGERKEGGGNYDLVDPQEPGRGMFTRRHHTAPATTFHRDDQNQYPTSSRTVTHQYYHQHFDDSSVSSSSGSSISSASSLSLSSITLESSDKACPTCNKTFSRSRDKARHMNSVHKVYKMNKCKVCGCCFTRMDSLLRHQRNKTCNNVNARSSPSSPTPLFRKGAVYGTAMALSSPP